MFDAANVALEDQITAYSAHLTAGLAGWLELVAEFDRREGYRVHDCISTAEWLGWRCGIAKRSAREQVRIARRLEDLPVVTERFRSGELSYSKVRALTRAATPATEASLVELALGTSASQLERICSSLRGALSIDDERIAHERRHLNYFWEDDGSLSFRGLLSGEEGALFVKALELARELMHREQPGDAAHAERITSADAITAVLESFLANGSAGSSGADRHQVIVHVDEEALSPKTGAGGSSTGSGRGSAEPPVEPVMARIADGPPISRETARRLSCDTSVVEMRCRDGEPLSVGRSRRTVPPAIRRALRSRDGCCRFPGCTNHLFVDAHHIQHWADGGETSVENLVLLCRRHHRLLHEGAFSLINPEIDDGVRVSATGEVRFVRPNGVVIEPAPAVPRSHPEAIIEVNRTAGLDPGPGALNARYCGQRLDLHLTIAGLCDREANSKRTAPRSQGETDCNDP